MVLDSLCPTGHTIIVNGSAKYLFYVSSLPDSTPVIPSYFESRHCQTCRLDVSHPKTLGPYAGRENERLNMNDADSKRDIMSILVQARKAELDGGNGEYTMNDRAMIDQVVSLLLYLLQAVNALI